MGYSPVGCVRDTPERLPSERRPARDREGVGGDGVDDVEVGEQRGERGNPASVERRPVVAAEPDGTPPDERERQELVAHEHRSLRSFRHG